MNDIIINLTKRVISYSGIVLLGIVMLNSCSKDETPGVYTVEYIPSQCAPQHSGVLGLKTNGEYYMVLSDNLGLFTPFVEGDKVKGDFTFTSEFAVCEACTCPSVSNGIIIQTIEKL